MHRDDQGHESDAEDEPEIDVLEVVGLGEAGLDFGVERDEDQHRGEAHGPSVLEVLRRDEESQVADGVEEDSGQVGGEQVELWATVQPKAHRHQAGSVH